MPLSCCFGKLLFPHYVRAKRDSGHEWFCGVVIIVGDVVRYDLCSRCTGYWNDTRRAMVAFSGNSRLHLLDHLHERVVYGQS